jgi:hypothetical protein
MIKLHELKVGDIIMAEFEGQRSEGEVIEVSGEEHEAHVQTAVQDFWFAPEDLYPIPLDEEQLFKFHFEKLEMEGGKVKYLRGPFRILLSGEGNFSSFEMWYREDRRHITRPLSVHELQNHYHQMTKVDLAREPAVKAG